LALFNRKNKRKFALFKNDTQPYRVAYFQKVSKSQFCRDASGLVGGSEAADKAYDDILLPSRATGGSAGYDFKAPYPFTLMPGDTIRIPTGIRTWISNGWWLCCVPRSGIGCKYKVALDNTVGVIDSDYYNSDNEGHIMIQMTNRGATPLHVHTGDNILQAIFVPYGITTNDNATEKRNGGFGSTDRRKAP
jgi:dUTP pyrophosphatase